MSKQKREEARDKIDLLIESLVSTEKDEQDQKDLKLALEGLADILFGYWTALESIAGAINDAVRKNA